MARRRTNPCSKAACEAREARFAAIAFRAAWTGVTGDRLPSGRHASASASQEGHFAIRSFRTRVPTRGRMLLSCAHLPQLNVKHGLDSADTGRGTMRLTYNQ